MVDCSICHEEIFYKSTRFNFGDNVVVCMSCDVKVQVEGYGWAIKKVIKRFTPKIYSFTGDPFLDPEGKDLEYGKNVKEVNKFLDKDLDSLRLVSKDGPIPSYKLQIPTPKEINYQFPQEPRAPGYNCKPKKTKEEKLKALKEDPAFINMAGEDLLNKKGKTFGPTIKVIK